MFGIEERIAAFEKLGRFVGQHQDEGLEKLNNYFGKDLQKSIDEAAAFNNWFTRNNVEYALQEWSQALKREKLEEWINRYSPDHFENNSQHFIALITAGNIPLVGFHDFLTVLMSGHKVMVKPSSDDKRLLPFLAQVLVAIDKRFAERIVFADGNIRDFKAVIATGSDNSARYFEYYFSKYPHIIRKNRSSVAVLNGEETEDDLKLLGEDVFRYYGLGCRNVSKVYLPQGFDLDRLFKAFFDFKEVIDNKKYSNNYDYNRAILMMEKQDFYENGFFIMKEKPELHAPVSMMHYEFYDKKDEVEEQLKSLENELQCIVGAKGLSIPAVPFGQTQKPQLWDYADNLDIVKFLRTV